MAQRCVYGAIRVLHDCRSTPVDGYAQAQHQTRETPMTLRMFAMLLLSIVSLSTRAAGTVSDDELGRWLNYYYLKPEPLQTLDYLVPLNESFKKHKGSSLAAQAERGGIRTFYAEILSTSDAAVIELEHRRGGLPSEIDVFVTEVLARCRSAECARVRGTAFEPRTAELSTSSLDDHWAAFNATGDREHVDAVIAALPLVEVRGDVDRLLIGGAAKWSLSSMAHQHSRVLEYCKAAVETADEPTKRLLTELIAEAEAERLKNPPPEPR